MSVVEKSVITSSVGSTPVVSRYEPKELTDKSAALRTNALSEQRRRESGFVMSDLITQQTALSEVERVKEEERVEGLVLERIKHLQEDAYREAFELGRIEGQKRGFEDQQGFLTEKLSDLTKLLETLDTFSLILLSSNEKEIISLLTEMASRIALRTIAVDQKAVLEALTGVLNDLQSEDIITVSLNHDDALFVSTMMEKLNRPLDLLKRVKIEPSSDILAGGCKIETAFGGLDATVETRVKRMRGLIEERLEALQPEHWLTELNRSQENKE